MKIEEVFELLTKYGDQSYFQQGVTHTSHMIQTAMLAEHEDQPHEVILGALLHDIGNLVGKMRNVEHVYVNDTNIGPKDHDTLGAEFLKEHGFPLEIYCFASHHAQAVRYLAYKDPTFMRNLPWISQQTLRRKGGPMKPEEATTFEKLPHYEAILKCREWDERARDPQAKLEPIHKYKAMAEKYLLFKK